MTGKPQSKENNRHYLLVADMTEMLDKIIKASKIENEV
jgi:hypothetical protein